MLHDSVYVKLKKKLLSDIQYYIKFLNRKNESVVSENRTPVTWDQRYEKSLMVMEIFYLLYKQYNIGCGGNYIVLYVNES